MDNNCDLNPNFKIKHLSFSDFIIKETNNKNVLVKELDLASFDSVRRFAADVIQTESQIHVLINNAGVSSLFKKELTKDGIELQMQSNHFGHFLLTNLLLGKHFISNYLNLKIYIKLLSERCHFKN